MTIAPNGVDRAASTRSRRRSDAAARHPPGFDALLWLSTTIWKRHCLWTLPDPGENLSVHEDLPLLRVVSVVEANAVSCAAALMRVPALAHAAPDGDLARWEDVLRHMGWMPVPGC